MAVYNQYCGVLSMKYINQSNEEKQCKWCNII